MASSMIDPTWVKTPMTPQRVAERVELLIEAIRGGIAMRSPSTMPR